MSCQQCCRRRPVDLPAARPRPPAALIPLALVDPEGSGVAVGAFGAVIRLQEPWCWAMSLVSVLQASEHCADLALDVDAGCSPWLSNVDKVDLRDGELCVPTHPAMPMS